MSTIDTDVLIVGYGPVGQTMAALLARRGHRVEVYERFADELDLLPVSTYEWFGADGEPILHMKYPDTGPSGWEPGYMFYQPTLERALDRAVRGLPSATVHHNWIGEALEQHGDHVEVTLRRVREPRTGAIEPTDQTCTVRARYVVGADGANSFVREASGI